MQEIRLLQSNSFVKPKVWQAILITGKAAKMTLASFGITVTQMAPLYNVTTAPAQNLLLSGRLANLEDSKARPQTLPECLLDEEWKTKKYGLDQGLQHLKHRVALHDQLSKLETWLTTKFNFTRKGKKLDSSTVSRMFSIITCYLGYCHRVHHVDLPLLDCLYNVDMLIAYISFLHWKGTAGPTFDKFFNAVYWVLRFWAAHTEDKEAKTLLEELKEWLQTSVRPQVKQGAPKKLHYLEHSSQALYSAQDIMRFQVRLVCKLY